MINIENKYDCCGCTACESVCSKHAITMKPDTLGFFYPVVDSTLCVDCGLCDKVCAFQSDDYKYNNLTSPVFYAARLSDSDELQKSQSGGAFWAIAQYVLQCGGVIYGAGFGEHFYVRHKRATTIEECQEFRGSKYVQSDIIGIYRNVKEDLKKGLTVLFTGTPCQTAGLDAFLPSTLKEHLLLVDLICHGVPSPKIWNDYLSYLEKKKNDIIIKANFRDKQMFDWHSSKATFIFSKQLGKKRWFYGKIYNTNTFRESCSVCKYCNTTRPSDITIGDFWNQSIPSRFNDDKGCSCIIVNSEKGLKVFDAIKQHLQYESRAREECMQFNLSEATAIDPNRFNFEELYAHKGFLKAMQVYSDLGWKKQLRLRVGEIKRNIIKLIRK